MNTRRTFLRSLPMMAIGAASAQTATTTTELTLDQADSAKTVEEIKKRIFLLDAKWKEVTFEKKEFLFVLSSFGDGESYIDLHGWIYNRLYKEWRRIMKINTRCIGSADLLIDERKGVVSVRGKANNEFDGVDVVRFDLRATSDDIGYVH